MESLETRIKAKVEELYPIVYLDTPTQKATCMIKRRRLEGLRMVRTIKMRDELFQLIANNQNQTTGTITVLIDQYFANYTITHPAENSY